MHHRINSKKFDELKEIVNRYYGIDCMKVCRDRVYVDARMVLYQILRDLKCSYTHIGNLVNRNHATIINALRKFETYIKYDPDLLKAYQDISDIYFTSTEENPIFFMSNKELISLAISLEKQNKSLHLINTELNLNLNKYQIKYGNIIDVLESSRKTEDKEVREYIKDKLKTVLNGIRSV